MTFYYKARSWQMVDKYPIEVSGDYLVNPNYLGNVEWLGELAAKDFFDNICSPGDWKSGQQTAFEIFMDEQSIGTVDVYMEAKPTFYATIRSESN